MDEKFKNVRSRWNQSVLRDVKVTSSEKQKILHSLLKTPKRRPPFNYYVAVGAALLLFILLVPSLFTSNQENARSFNASETLRDLYGYSLFIPTYEDYVVKYAQKINNDRGGVDITFYYVREIGDNLRVDVREPEDFMFGPSELQDVIFTVTYRDQRFTEQELSAPYMGFNEVKVKYEIVEMDNIDYYVASFNALKGGSYQISYNTEKLGQEEYEDLLDDFLYEMYEFAYKGSGWKWLIYNVSLILYAASFGFIGFGLFTLLVRTERQKGVLMILIGIIAFAFLSLLSKLLTS